MVPGDAAVTFKEWWHVRTDDLHGVDKLIGEPGSMFRQNVVIPGLFVAAFAVAIYVTWPRSS
jgi:hypothetical protein